MSSWPPIWRTRTLESADIPVTPNTLRVILAWHKSTPLPPLSNNPLGMPAGSSGAPSYLGTAYAIFPSMGMFYTAFTTWSKSYAGKQLVQAITTEAPFAATWRVVSGLGWPGSSTETDYPSALLDLTEQSYRNSVKATPLADRKTSGQVGKDPATRNEIIEQSRSINHATASIGNTRDAVKYLIRRHAKNG
jgi:hypothetical protein